MTIIDTFYKQPAETLDYDINYTSADLPDGDTIASALSFAERVDATEDPEQLAVGVVTPYAARVKTWLGAGTNGGKYKVTVRATSAGGRVFEDEFIVIVKDD